MSLDKAPIIIVCCASIPKVLSLRFFGQNVYDTMQSITPSPRGPDRPNTTEAPSAPSRAAVVRCGRGRRPSIPWGFPSTSFSFNLHSHARTHTSISHHMECGHRYSAGTSLPPQSYVNVQRSSGSPTACFARSAFNATASANHSCQ